ncbi:MAG: NrfD/PsrC family molybdoenzyme membrane anchor subunit [Planctomycetota bacterium]|jgi:molybdopterin-containing oxidoreductase family membrane subunit
MNKTTRRALIGLLTIAVLGGGLAAFRQLSLGLGATALREPVVWGLYVVCFAYFTGVGAGALTVASSAISLGEKRHRPVALIAAAASLVSLALAGLFIVMDLGRPDRALLMVLKGRFKSPLFWDFVVLHVMMGSAAFYCYSLLRSAALEGEVPRGGRLGRLLTAGYRPGGPDPVARLLQPLAAVMVVGAPLCYVLTVRVFSSLRARVDWNTTGLAPVFLISALLSGLAAVALAYSLSRGRVAPSGSERPTGRFLAAGLIVLILVDVLVSLSPVASMRQFDSPSRHVIWSNFGAAALLEMGLGLFLPLAILLASHSRPRPRLGAASALILLGVFIKRWHVIVPALGRRSLPLSDVRYVPNLVEVGVSVGLLAIGLLLLFLLIGFSFPASARRETGEPGEPEPAQ